MRAAIATASLVAAALSPSALAAGQGSSPINPAVSQYVEMIPTATGEKPATSHDTQPATAVVPTQEATTPATTPTVEPKQKPGKKRQTPSRRRPPTRQRPAAVAAATDSPSFAAAVFGAPGAGGVSLLVLAALAVIIPLALARSRR